MRRYTLNISGKEYVVDVQETDFDQFEVQVGGQSYSVSLSEDQAVGGVSAAPAASPVAAASPAAAPKAVAAPAAAAAAPKAAVPKKPAGGGKGALKAPMPGVILEVNVKPGDKVTRGQQVAILDAMKMHNVVGAPRDGTIAEVCVAAGQSVGHGDVIVTFAEG